MESVSTRDDSWTAPPGQEQKAAYQGNMLKSMALVYGTACLAALYWHLDTGPDQQRSLEPSKTRSGSISLRGSTYASPPSGGNVQFPLPDNAPRAGFLGFWTAEALRKRIVEDHVRPNPAATARQSSIVSAGMESVAFPIHGSGDVFGQLAAASLAQEIRMPANVFTPIGSWGSSGGEFDFKLGDTISEPIVDIRQINPPPIGRFGPDTVVVRVNIHIDEHDQLTCRVVSEEPASHGFGEAVERGLLAGQHRAIEVNGLKYATHVELWVYFCDSCGNQPARVQRLKILAGR